MTARLAGFLTLGLLLTGCANSAAGQALPTTDVVRLLGTVTISGSIRDNGTQNGVHACEGARGYSDLRLGAQVVVYDEAGTVIAKGTLQDGRYVDPPAKSQCSLAFEVEHVPASAVHYQVEVTHRGKVVVPQDRIRQPLQLTIGD